MGNRAWNICSLKKGGQEALESFPRARGVEKKRQGWLVWWFYAASELNSTANILSLTLLKVKRGENMMEGLKG